MRTIDKNGDGRIDKDEFVGHFEKVLPKERVEFDRVIAQFMEAARHCSRDEDGAGTAHAGSKGPRTPNKQRHSAVDEQLKESLSAQKAAKMARQSNSEDREEKMLSAMRRAALSAVFEELDLDSSGYIEPSELMVLGTARQSMGQKARVWTEEKNLNLVRRMDKNGDGQIEKEEFIGHFEKALPRGQVEFERVIAQFMEAARHCARASKLANEEDVWRKNRTRRSSIGSNTSSTSDTLYAGPGYRRDAWEMAQRKEAKEQAEIESLRQEMKKEILLQKQGGASSGPPELK